MSYTALVLVLMCLGAGQSVKLTKDIDLIFEPRSVQTFEFSTIINHLIQPTRALVSNLATVLKITIEPNASDVLDAVNEGLGINLLVIEDDMVQLDAAQLRTALCKAAKDVSRNLYPDDYVKQIEVYSVMLSEVFQMNAQIQSTINATKVPVRLFDEALRDRHYLTKRGIQTRDLFSDIYESLIRTIESAICDNIVSEVQSFINSTLTSWITMLQNIDVESSGDFISDILSTTVQLEMFFIEQSLNFTNQWLDSDANTVCSSLLSSISSSTNSTTKRRRDVSKDLTTSLQRNLFTDLFGGIWGLVLGLVSIVVNPVLKLAVSVILNLLGSILYTLVDSAFQPIL